MQKSIKPIFNGLLWWKRGLSTSKLKTKQIKSILPLKQNDIHTLWYSVADDLNILQ